MDTLSRIYLDYAASTPVDQRVFEAMRPYFSESFGNPSALHWAGQAGERAVEKARMTAAEALNCDPGEVVFTSGGTESDNLALRGAAIRRWKTAGARHLLISPVEHHAVSHTAAQLGRDFDFQVEYLAVDGQGRVDPAEVARRIRADTALVSVIYANNEIGTINPVAEIGQVCRERGVPFHTDAVQAAAYLKMDVRRDNVDFLAIGAHKFYGPKGVGALYIRKGAPVQPVQTGGGQEHGLRAGTHNVPYIIGLAEALRLGQAELAAHTAHFLPLRERLIGQVLEEIPETRLTGDAQRRLPNHASFVFHGVDGNLLLMLLDQAGFACSSGSACKTGSPEPSEVLTALGLERAWGLGALRVTLGRATTAAEIQAFVGQLPGLVAKARSLA